MPKHSGFTGPFEPLLSEELARQARDQHQRSQKRRYEHKPPEAREEGPQGPAIDFAQDTSDTSHEEDSMSIFSFLIPPLNPKPETIRRYRIAVSISITVIFLLFGAVYGFFESVGIYGFVRSESLEKTIKSETKPLEVEISKQTVKINEQTVVLERVSRQVTEQLAAGTATEIRANVAKRCLEQSGQERERINREIDRLQNQYAEYKNYRYSAPTCAEL